MTLRQTTTLAALLLAGGLPLTACRAREGEAPAAPTAATPAAEAGAATGQPATPETAAGPGGATAPAGAAPAGPSAAGTRSWTRNDPPADLPRDRPLRAGFLVVDGVSSTELTAPYDVLHHTRSHTRPHAIQVFTVSPDGRQVTTFEGLKLTPDHSFADAPAMDVLVLPSGRGSRDRDLQNVAIVDWVRQAGGQARYVVALCGGSFLLARAGLLDGVAATTCPDDYDRFAQRFPNVEHRINVSFVRDGKYLTSQGGALSYQVAMYLVDELFGEEVATAVGHGLLVPWPPDLETEPPFAVESPDGPAATAGTAGAPAAPVPPAQGGSSMGDLVPPGHR